MSSEELLIKLEEIFHDIFADDSIKLNESTNADDIEEWDSLTHISILAAVQDDLGVSFDMDEITAMKNVGDMIKAILEKM